MTKQTFNTFRLEDLTGGINVRDYESEIEDKQCTHLLNFNFSGNKLVSEKGWSDSGLTPIANIGALTIDSGDIWTISNGYTYKNGTIINNGNGVLLDTTTNVFKPGIYYYIVLDAVEYKATGSSLSEFLLNMKGVVEGAGFQTVIQDTKLLIYRASGAPITVTDPGYKTYLLYNNDATISGGVSTEKYKYNRVPVTFGFTLNGTTYSGWWERPNGILDKNVEYEFMNYAKTIIPSGFDATLVYLKKNTETGLFEIVSNLVTYQYVGIVISKVNAISIPVINKYNGYIVLYGSTTSAFSITIDGNVLNFSGTTNSVDILNAINGISGYKAIWKNGLGSYPEEIRWWRISDMAQMTLSGGYGPINELVIQTEILSQQFTDNKIEVQNLLTGNGLKGRANLKIGNLGNLAVDKDDGGAYYSYVGLNVKIGEEKIGKPTVGTIYNGKIVLGGFEGNDNIIFSQTSSPSQPLNVFNFTEYSSGGQSISGGDKGEITGMIVGENGLYVFKDNSIWYSNSEKDDPTSQSFNLVFNKITSSGALTQNAITEVQQEIFYLDWKTRAVRRLGYEQNLTTLRDTAISNEIRPLLEALPNEQSLATSHFIYPNYVLSLSDGNGGTITYPNGKTYYKNNVHFIYNVDNKSWTTRNGYINIISDKGYFVKDDWKVYKDFQGNIQYNSELISKLYTFGDDVMYKKYGQFELVGKTIGTKSLVVEIYVDGEKVDERQFNYNNSQIREKIELYDIGQGVRWKIIASGNGLLELYDAHIKWKMTTISPQDYN